MFGKNNPCKNSRCQPKILREEEAQNRLTSLQVASSTEPRAGQDLRTSDGNSDSSPRGGSHTIERCEEVTDAVLHAVSHALFEKGVALEGMLLKPNNPRGRKR
jgi:fructose-bisphosphate aldolase class I